LYCRNEFQSDTALRHHIGQPSQCRDRMRDDYFQFYNGVTQNDELEASEDDNAPGEAETQPMDVDDNFMDIDDPPLIDEASAIPHIPPPQPTCPRTVTVEDVEEEDFRSSKRYERRPFAGQAGTTFGEQQPTPFKLLCQKQLGEHQSIYHPFADVDEWRFVRFISKHLGKTQVEELLDLAFVGPFTLAFIQYIA
jgi:hypothetical protein